MTIRTPDCPMCGYPPSLPFVTPYFCSNEDCKVVYWDPSMTLAEIRTLEPEVIDLDVIPGPPESIVDHPKDREEEQ